MKFIEINSNGRVKLPADITSKYPSPKKGTGPQFNIKKEDIKMENNGNKREVLISSGDL